MAHRGKENPSNLDVSYLQLRLAHNDKITGQNLEKLEEIYKQIVNNVKAAEEEASPKGVVYRRSPNNFVSNIIDVFTMKTTSK